MTLFQDTGGDPRTAAAKLADVLAWYGALSDIACGNPPGFGLRKASVAVALCDMHEPTAQERAAVFFAGILHAIGTLGNAAYRKGSDLSERVARMEAWDVPAHGARVCATIDALPELTPDLVRWQSERWDGTGFPDQLRWHGIPRHAQCLALADALLRAEDPEEALGAIGLQSGRAFSPEATRSFVMWFHLNAGEAPVVEPPLDMLRARADSAERLLEAIADRVDDHNGVPGRWRRVERFALAAARKLHGDDSLARSLQIATRVYGAAETPSANVEDSQFDPLARLGVDHRAKHAALAAALVANVPSFGDAAEVVAARGEWFDGTGRPRGLMHAKIPFAAAILAASIAYDKLDRGERLEGAAGTQFDPRIARALSDVVKTPT